MSAKKLKVTLVKSRIGAKPNVFKTIEALGLRKMNFTKEFIDNASVRGMLFKVKHLVKVEEIN